MSLVVCKVTVGTQLVCPEQEVIVSVTVDNHTSVRVAVVKTSLPVVVLK